MQHRDVTGTLVETHAAQQQQSQRVREQLWCARTLPPQTDNKLSRCYINKAIYSG